MMNENFVYFRKLISLSYITFSKTFDKMHNRETSDNYQNTYQQLYTKYHIGNFQFPGKTPSDEDKFKMWTNGNVIDDELNLSASAVLSSGPGVEYFSS